MPQSDDAGNQTGKSNSGESGDAGATKDEKQQAGDAGAGGSDDKSGAGDEKHEPEEKKFSQSDLDRILKKEREKIEKKSKLTEDERIKQERDDAIKELNERKAFDDFDAAASSAGATKSRALFKLMKDDLEYNDQGKITNLKDVMKTARNDYPEFFKKVEGSGDGGAGGERSSTKSMNDFIRGKR